MKYDTSTLAVHLKRMYDEHRCYDNFQKYTRGRHSFETKTDRKLNSTRNPKL